MIGPGELRSPSGDLADSLFPGESASKLEDRLQGYIDEGAALVAAAGLTGPQEDVDEAVKNWAYYRAYGAVYVRMINSPSTVIMEGQGQNSTLWSQIEAFKTLRDEHLVYYRNSLPVTITESAALLPPSTSVRTVFDY